MSDFSSKFIRRGGYSFDEGTVIDMVRQSSQFAQMDVEIEASLADGQTITSTNIQELLEDPYVRGNVIDQLVIRAWNTKAAPLLRHVMIILRNNAAGEGVLVLLRADRNSCTLTRAELQNLIDGRRQWYSRLFPTAGWLVLLKSIWSISVAVVTGMLVGLWVPGQVSLALWCALISLLTLGTAGIYLMNTMFPMVLFEIGRSQRRAENARLLRNVVGVVLILGRVDGFSQV
jgi:hypothetical protein